jgi:hypothetical protein
MTVFVTLVPEEYFGLEKRLEEMSVQELVAQSRVGGLEMPVLPSGDR